MAAYELLVVTPAIANLIRENKTYRITSDIQTGKKHGMVLMDDSLFNLWKQGLVEKEDVLRKAIKAADLRQRIELVESGALEDEDEEYEEEYEEEEYEDDDEEEEPPKRGARRK
jgi:twitching motility protein PilT